MVFITPDCSIICRICGFLNCTVLFLDILRLETGSFPLRPWRDFFVLLSFARMEEMKTRYFNQTNVKPQEGWAKSNESKRGRGLSFKIKKIALYDQVSQQKCIIL